MDATRQQYRGAALRSSIRTQPQVRRRKINYVLVNFKQFERLYIQGKVDSLQSNEFSASELVGHAPFG